MCAWQEVSKTKTEGEAWDFNLNPEFIGNYVGKKINTGKNKNSTIWSFEGDGKQWWFWGSMVLDDALSAIHAGERVKIRFNGKKKSKSGNYFKDWSVWIDTTGETEDPNYKKEIDTSNIPF